MRSVCAPSVCNSDASPLASRCALYRRGGDRALSLGGRAAAALHPVAPRHAARDCLALFHCTGGDILITTFTLGAVAALAWHFHWRVFWLAHGLHRDRSWRRLHYSQRMAERRNPPHLVLYRGDAGPSLNRHRPHTVAAVGGRARPCFLPSLWAGTDANVGRGGEGCLHLHMALCYAGIVDVSEPFGVACPFREAIPPLALPHRGAVACSRRRQCPCRASSPRRSRPALP